MKSTINETDIYYYHPDHLGSSSWITGTGGQPIQHLQYLPFGETVLDQRTTSWNTRFSFSAKEKDEESGYSYFSARYYDSELSIWLSVDPLAHKTPGVSPYAYCVNNPIKLVDPNGMDIWTVHEDGTINRQENKKIDRIDVVDKDGNTTKGTEAKYGTIKQHTTSVEVEGKKDPVKLDYFEIKGDDLAKETFENIANNTSIEWTHAKVGTENSGSNIVGTSHDKKSTVVGSFLRETGYTLKESNHNHPNGNSRPSREDLNNRDNYLNKSPNINLNIYTKQEGYRSYTKLKDIIRFNVRDYVR